MRHAFPTVRTVLVAAALSIALPALSRAQAVDTTRLDVASRAAIERTINAARTAGLPVEPLRNKVIEGLSKGADGPLIAKVVEQLRGRIERAATALGRNTSTPDLVAAAAVLDLGVTDAQLRRVRTARPDDAVASALVGLAFLVQTGAQTDGAINVVCDMLIARVPDAEFDRFRESVARDVYAGASVTGAARTRAEAAILRVQRGGGRIDGIAPGAALP